MSLLTCCKAAVIAVYSNLEQAAVAAAAAVQWQLAARCLNDAKSCNTHPPCDQHRKRSTEPAHRQQAGRAARKAGQTEPQSHLKQLGICKVS